MKKYSLIFAAIFAVISILTSCSEIDDVAIQDTEQQQQGSYTYNLHLNSDAPNFDGTSTRATSSSWISGSVIYLRFLKSGTSSTYISGKATYNGSSWSFTTTSQLQATSSNTSCSAVYVENPVSTNSSTITMSPNSAAYKGTGTYTCSSNDIYVNVTLSPVTARLRFKGNSNTKINLPGDKNDIKYISTISLSSLDITTAKADASLTVSSNGYTPYIYGVVTNPDGNNNVYITNISESKNYQLSTFAGSKLPEGSSGYLTVPSNSNYNSLGWKIVDDIDRNAYVVPNFMAPFTDGMCTDWTVGSSAKTVYFTMFKDLSIYNSDEEIIAEIIDGNTAKDAQPYSQYINLWSGDWYSPNTTYYMCTISYNADGVRGPLQKYEFRTNTTNLPIATISNLKLTSDTNGNCWTYNVSMSNNGSKYYVYVSEDNDDLDWDDRYLAYYVYRWIKDGSITEFYDWSSVRTTRNSTKCMVLTYALDSKSNIGNFNCVRYPTSSSIRAAKRNFNTSITSNTINKSSMLPISSFKGTVRVVNQPLQ